MPRGQTPEKLAQMRANRWARKSAEERSATARRTVNYRWVRIRGSNLERIINIQGRLAVIMKEAFESGEHALAIQASLALGRWESLRIAREKTEPGPSIEYQPPFQCDTSSPLTKLDEAELRRLASSVLAYRGADPVSSHHRSTMTLVTGRRVP